MDRAHGAKAGAKIRGGSHLGRQGSAHFRKVLERANALVCFNIQIVIPDEVVGNSPAPDRKRDQSDKN